VDETYEAELDQLIDPVVDATPALPPAPELPHMNSASMLAFCVDVAQKISPYPLIAARYGFVDEAQMRDYIQDNAVVRFRIKELRSVWFSDMNLQNRVRTLAGHAVLAALPNTAEMMFNDAAAPAPVRIDALKTHARIAGVDSLPAAAREGASTGAAEGAKFSVQIVFSGGRVENIATGAPAPGPPVIEGVIG
jgi:alkylhydroperoxidase/carboxymuconolactone decarboxylase family protein YurZ